MEYTKCTCLELSTQVRASAIARKQESVARCPLLHVSFRRSATPLLVFTTANPLLACLQQPNSFYYKTEGDFCRESAGRMACDALGACGKWGCDLVDFVRVRCSPQPRTY